MTITSDILKNAGFECIDRDLTTEKWELRTKWQTLHLWHNFKAYNAPYRMCGLKHSDDRFTVRDTQEIYDFAMLSGADIEMKHALKVFDEAMYHDKMEARCDILVDVLQTICDATTDVECYPDDDDYIPVFRYEPQFEFSMKDLAIIHRLADECLQDFSSLTERVIKETTQND